MGGSGELTTYPVQHTLQCTFGTHYRRVKQESKTALHLSSEAKVHPIYLWSIFITSTGSKCEVHILKASTQNLQLSLNNKVFLHQCRRVWLWCFRSSKVWIEGYAKRFQNWYLLTWIEKMVVSLVGLDQGRGKTLNFWRALHLVHPPPESRVHQWWSSTTTSSTATGVMHQGNYMWFWACLLSNLHLNTT